MLLRTTDGGATWRSQPLAGETQLSQLCVLDDTHSWAIERYEASYAGVALSTDGGATWIPSSTATFRTLTAVEALGTKQAVAVGERGTIVATADGSTWQARQSPTTEDLAGLAFYDREHGWAVGDDGTMIATADGGMSWREHHGTTTADVKDVCFVDDAHGWAVGAQGTILHTTDGSTWTPQQSGLDQSFELTSVFFLDAQRGWTTGYDVDSKLICKPSRLLGTTDGGQHWQLLCRSHWGETSTICFLTSNLGWATGNLGNGIRHTDDGGLTWPDGRTTRAESTSIAVRFLDRQHGWVVSEKGRISTSHNGGESWTVENTGFTRDLLDVDFFDEGHGWAVGEGGAIIAYPDPVPRATQPSKVRRGRIATLRYKVGASRSARVDVKIRIRNKRGKVVRILAQRNRRPNRTYTIRFRCKLPRGGYRFYVSATDSTGRHQRRQGANKLTVMRRR